MLKLLTAATLAITVMLSPAPAQARSHGSSHSHSSSHSHRSSSSSGRPKTERVRSYNKKDGTHVDTYNRAPKSHWWNRK